MDSYLSNIDTYMQQQQQQEQLLKRQRQQQLLLQQQQQQQQQHLRHHQPSQPHQPQQPMTEDWLRNMSNLTVGPNPDSLFPNPTLYMSNTNAYNTTMSNNSGYVLPPPQSNYMQPMQPPPGYDINGQPIRIRKKPGRKPNPASPALRKAQNRAAQRAFRERKERHLKDLETTIRNLREQRNNATRELNSLKGNLESYKAENWYLKGVVLTLQFVCMHHNINIPTHSPYLAEDALAKIAQTTPHAIEAYVNSYTRNNTNLKSTMSYHFTDNSNQQQQHLQQQQEEQDRQANVGTESVHQDYDMEHDERMDYNEEGEEEYEIVNSPPSKRELSIVKSEDEDNSVRLNWLKQLDEKQMDPTATYSPPPPLQASADRDLTLNPPTSSMDAIQHIRLKLGVQSLLADNDDQAAARLKPTILQLAIPHDPRIDLVPTPHMRDRMIIFRDQMDYDRCFTMLLNGAIYHGGDPTMSESWELPAEFFSEFWYLTIDYDIKKTNKWRRVKGLADVEPGPQQQQQQEADKNLNWSGLLQNCTNGEGWDDEVFEQIVKGMPTLQPVDQQSGYPLSPPRQLDASSPSSSSSNSQKHIFTRLMTAPELRPQVETPSLENIIDIMNKSIQE